MRIVCEHCSEASHLALTDPLPDDKFVMNLRCPSCAKSMKNAERAIRLAFNAFDDMVAFKTAYIAYVEASVKDDDDPTPDSDGLVKETEERMWYAANALIDTMEKA